MYVLIMTMVIVSGYGKTTSSDSTVTTTHFQHLDTCEGARDKWESDVSVRMRKVANSSIRHFAICVKS